MSLVLDASADLGPIEGPELLPLGRLRAGDGVRSGGLDEAHVALLMETEGQWPPIVVWGPECHVVDGAHRLEAARRLGLAQVATVRFVGTREEAFVEAVRRNVDHGLPLSMDDRRRAARRVLTRHGDWSDRRIALVCGLSGRTVARMRREFSGRGSGEDGVVIGLERRVGRDGKLRPVQADGVRERIRGALQDHPGASLRAIAAVAGASPETVRAVRARLAETDESKPSLQVGPGHSCRSDSRRSVRPGGDQRRMRVLASRHAPVSDGWTSDAALLASGDGGDFARWFASNDVGDDWHPFVWTVPLGRVYEVVDEARRRAAAWMLFASLLESRTR